MYIKILKIENTYSLSKYVPCLTSGFHREVDENCTLLGYYKVSSSRGQLKCDDTREKTRFSFSAKRMSPFKLAGASVRSTTGSRGVHISGSNAGYTIFEVV